MNIAKKFIDGITAKQLEDFISSVFKLTDKKRNNIILDCMDEDVSKIYKTIVKSNAHSSNSDASKIIATDDKFEEEFKTLLLKLNSCIMELGDEEGEYVDQEHHWDSPEFDAYSFSNDIDKVFTQMLPMLNRIHELNIINDDYFTNLAEEIESGITSFPEWMGAEYSEFELDKKGAECILKWNWLNRESINSFLTKTKEFYYTKPCTSHFAQSFLQDESKENLKELYNELCALKKASGWTEEINNVNSIWHDIFHTTEKVADNTAFLKTSQDMINQKWEYGIPVYENYNKNEDFVNAEEYCGLSVSEFFRQNTYGDFNTNINHTIYATHCNKTDPRLNKIFTDWVELCKTLDISEKAGAVKVQYDFYLKPYDWKNLRTLFLNNKGLSCYDNYLREWKLFVQRKTLPHNYSSDNNNNWLNWLIDFLLDENKQSFIVRTAKWLESPIKVTSSFDRGKDFQLLLRLSKDILPATGILNSYPTLKSYIVTADHSSFDVYDFGAKDPSQQELNSNRLAYLKQTGTESLKENIINAWMNNVHKFIPSPADVRKADYSRHAKWLAIAKELNTDIYRRFYNNWKSNHNRKRNLWAALKSHGIHK